MPVLDIGEEVKAPKEAEQEAPSTMDKGKGEEKSDAKTEIEVKQEAEKEAPHESRNPVKEEEQPRSNAAKEGIGSANLGLAKEPARPKVADHVESPPALDDTQTEEQIGATLAPPKDPLRIVPLGIRESDLSAFLIDYLPRLDESLRTTFR